MISFWFCSYIEKIANIKNYKKFNPPKIIDSKIQESIRMLPNYNNQHSITLITKDIYESIVSEIKKDVIEATPDLETFDDTPLTVPKNNDLLNGIARIQEELLIEKDVITQIVVNLASGRQLSFFAFSIKDWQRSSIVSPTIPINEKNLSSLVVYLSLVTGEFIAYLKIA
jgi:hypothetical protein